jgi:hypothetical protein
MWAAVERLPLSAASTKTRRSCKFLIFNFRLRLDIDRGTRRTGGNLAVGALDGLGDLTVHVEHGVTIIGSYFFTQAPD